MTVKLEDKLKNFMHMQQDHEKLSASQIQCQKQDAEEKMVKKKKKAKQKSKDEIDELQLLD